MIRREQNHAAAGVMPGRPLRLASIAVGLVLLGLALTDPAAAQGQSAQTVQRAAVHQTPGGAIVDGVPGGRSVQVLSRQGAWAEIAYDKGGIALKGWVELARLHLGAGAAALPQHKPEPTLPKGSYVTIMTTNLDCKEKAFGDGFESCAVHVQATVSLDAVPPARPTVRLSCGAEITTHSQFSPYSKVREMTSKTFPLNRVFSLHQMTIDFRFPGPVTSVDGEEVRCLLQPLT